MLITSGHIVRRTLAKIHSAIADASQSDITAIGIHDSGEIIRRNCRVGDRAGIERADPAEQKPQGHTKQQRPCEASAAYASQTRGDVDEQAVVHDRLMAGVAAARVGENCAARMVGPASSVIWLATR